ncbi:MAG: glutamine--tRNA ligase, partial [Chitinophagaceae bacterium]|nr:glutamine--tRNA ligase [Chitinophagaceae bacterium]
MSEEKSLNFLEEIIEADLASGKTKTVHTRFPPEPNGYLHLGHAKSICLNFGLGDKYKGKTNLRFDDTNPVTEDTEYVDSIKEDIKWLGFYWEEEHYASDYFDQLYDFAVKLIEKGLAYVDDLSAEEIAATKGTPTEPGKESPYRSRSIEENILLFQEMKDGKYKDGEKVLRAKIDLTSPNMHMRDPIMYRIKHAAHHRTGNQWCIYPMYDFAHGARLNLTYTVMSKRKLLQLVQEKIVDGWDDPRMPTLSGIRRRGFTPAAVRNFCERIGVQRRENVIDVGLLEFFVREDLNKSALRRMVVLDPIKLIISNYPEGKSEMLKSENNPDPAKKWFRLAPGMKVRLKSAYIVECKDFKKDINGKVTEVHCEYIPESKSGQDSSGINVKGTIHWIDAHQSSEAEVRLYDRLFKTEDPSSEEGDFKTFINPNSLEIIPHAKIEASLNDAKWGEHFQFIRKG